MKKLYEERDIMALDVAGDFYAKHVDAMTREGLHSKSDIAAELAWRDKRIADLEEELDDAKDEINKLQRENINLLEQM